MRNTGHYLLQLRGGDREQWPKDEDGQLLEPVKDGTMVDIKGDLLILAVGNGRQAGGGVPLCPDAGVCATLPRCRCDVRTGGRLVRGLLEALRLEGAHPAAMGAGVQADEAGWWTTSLGGNLR